MDDDIYKRKGPASAGLFYYRLFSMQYPDKYSVPILVAFTGITVRATELIG